MTKKSITNLISLVLILLMILIIIIYSILYSKLCTNDAKKEASMLSGNITFVSNRTDKRLELNELISQFEEINPNVKVKLELIGDAEEILDRKSSVGELPDVTLVPSTLSQNHYQDYFLSIDDLGFSKEDVYNYYLGTGDDESLYALSTSLSWFGVIYNKRIFEECGIEKIPTTNEELFASCEKIKENNIVPMVLNYKQSWIMNTWIEDIPKLLNPDFEDNIISNKYKILDENSELYKSLNLAKNIYDNEYCEKDILNYDWTQCKNDIVDGKIAMIIWNSDFRYQLQDMGMDEEELGMFPIPYTTKIQIGGDYKIAISKTTEHEKEAKAFLKFLFEDDRYAKAVNIMSTLKESNRSINFFNNLKSFNVPVEFQGDIIIKESEEEKRNHEKYKFLKNNLNINYTFVQQYITSEDTKRLREKINEEYEDGK